ncbi:MAG TPA: ATP-binding protein [Vicinamibacterales bacterium]|nr:ATP-binding protein [Vicinamibacterales bacterium]
MNAVSELEKIASAIEEIAEAWGAPPKVAMQVNLAVEELFTNVVFHGFPPDKAADHQTRIQFTRPAEGGAIIVTLADDGGAFNPFEAKRETGIGKPLEERKVGGLGIHFVTQTMDSVQYARRDGKNVVTLVKKF